MNEMVIINVDIVSTDCTITSGSVRIQEGKIAEVSTGTLKSSGTVVDGKGRKMMPGFIDVHIHGAAGHDVMDATPEALHGMSVQLPGEGTTSFLATTMTQSRENITNAIKNAGSFMESLVSGEGAEMLGIHLEGPFISEKKAGAQHPDHIIKPSVELFQEWQQESRGHIKLVTVAPETEGASAFIEEVSRTGVVCSLGHSDARFDQVTEAVERGARHVTHLYNQMSGLHHREPGLVGAAFMNDHLLVEMIVDHIHVHPDAVKLAYQNIGSGRSILITDAMRAKCLPPGTYDLGGQDVFVENNEARLSDGTLAGSILTLEEAAKKMKQDAGLSWQELVSITSWNAAVQLGVENRKGGIEQGKDADLVLVDEQGNVTLTMCRGTISYNAEEGL
ncbi:N-acetylglucosamine-6-phosphate deacetylase [Halobacillus kuroshimensis]|uniref:N-acetylglucosamine-6-phosphate deacetylase n=1 Tax=Halobacillus kuroshimensis TaxID=302481 RepID=A0ABS3DRX1_9BACI|nr:N-acetylglucosamine-6-phosphate deacetylase [Halobacillus kuroshimensis]MBN8234093.1 N-acetylglucosamine-6-phosphate deacetylase [Halobacillus kuroshimensis]